jgi:hypothetical protein
MWVIKRLVDRVGVSAVPAAGTLAEGQDREVAPPLADVIHPKDDPGRPVLSDIENAAFMAAGTDYR